ncbi:MAG: hypothetical protein A2275_03985 [Bacteroidetes bacterium RIFOXYA12_FULL_35_11]|nr:MAG: hypothetical protein A2X01_02925 [Bacteroidetes bacterium GWF2_35_48]OFY73450.1 MAG: hypothetical protein A2275_03985 [Bacteroidetes bacterium RIFOXYA12_FULL_35_11]OFY95301.1 MAG: hypothetical protein A2491_20775 [Bacteroidetes bacterium RIFOXYC12_FULL_35_7]HBX52354.1 hypothetical protein [Bacteroidales bacterium]
MKNYNNKISNLLDQLRQVDNMIMTHNNMSDDIMSQQYQARKADYMKDLVYELISLNASTPRINEIIKIIINKLEQIKPITNEKEISVQYKFSLSELESIVLR